MGLPLSPLLPSPSNLGLLRRGPWVPQLGGGARETDLSSPPEGWGPEGCETQKFAFFLLSCHKVLLSLGVSSRGIVVAIQGFGQSKKHLWAPWGHFAVFRFCFLSDEWDPEGHSWKSVSAVHGHGPTRDPREPKRTIWVDGHGPWPQFNEKTPPPP